MIEILMAYLWEKYEKMCQHLNMQDILRNSEKKRRFAFSVPFNLTKMV